jgi:cyclic pyranopterin phosphate synthase
MAPRRAGTLRVNLLEQCQLACAYCRPGAVRGFTPNGARLTVDEYARLAVALGGLGLRKVRFTGGEPLLHPHVDEVVAAFHRALPGVALAVTTNGLRLPEKLDALVAAGLSGATVHLDSLRRERASALMGDTDVLAILEAVALVRRRLTTVKVNCVVQRGRNDDEAWDFLETFGRLGVEVRFIELMNTGSAVAYTREAFVSGAAIVARIAERGPVTALPRRHAADPAALFRTHTGLTFGVIASDTAPFCGDCDRLRLSPDGRLRGCLYEPGGVDLRGPLRQGASAAALADLVAATAAAKASHHPSRVEPGRAFSMSEVGG